MSASMTVEQAQALVRQLERVCKTRPTVNNLVKLSTCYFTLGDLESAIPLAEFAYQKEPNNSIVAYNLAMIWKDYGDHIGSAKLLKVIYEELDDESEFVRLAYSESLLRQEKWKEAWPIYNTCRQSKEDAALAIGIPLHVKEWNGKDEKVEKLLVIDEGGFGDSITYSRYLNFLNGLNWIYAPFPELIGFYERILGSEKLVHPGTSMDVSHWTTTQSLAGYFTPIIPRTLCFKADPNLIQKFKVNRGKKPILGLCWKGREDRNGGRKIHSMTEGQAMRLVCKTDHLVEWINLQHDANLPEPVINVKISSFEELAGLITNLDGVVSVETAPMCLAYALGKKLVIVLSANSDWKFTDSGAGPFFPKADCFRNEIGYGIDYAITKTIDFVQKEWDEKKRLVLVGE